MITIMSLVALVNFNCHTEKPKTDTPTYAGLREDVTYVGMNSCRECHQSIYDSFIQTGMGKSFDLASRSKSSAEFGNHHRIYDKETDFWYYPFWENDSMRIMEYRLDGKDTIHKRIETVTYIIGSGQHTNSHLMNTSGYVNQMPMTFYTQKGHWDLPPGFENGGNSRFSRLIGLECMSCHNSYPVMSPGSENKYEFIDNGINCERCHGPGEVHVKEKKEGKVVDIATGIDYSIVNPAKLPIDLQLDVCQRCHIQGNAILNEGKSFFDFKPGMRLSEVMNVFMPVYRGRENEHIMASHVERMKLSKCFTVSAARAEQNADSELRPYKNALTCITCHNPHVSVKQAGTAHFNASCNSCHAPGKDAGCSENKEVLQLKKYDCVSCHMPASGTTDIPHVSVHDHLIRIPVREEAISKIKEFIGINCINNPEPGDQAKGKAFIAYYEKFNFGKEVLDSAKKYFKDQSPAEIQNNFSNLVHIAFLEKNFAKIISYTASLKQPLTGLQKKSYDNTDAWTSYRIGEAYRESGNPVTAQQYFANAYQLAPLHPEFANKYASILSVNNNQKEARTILEKTVKDYPKYAPALSNLGYLVLVMESDTAYARKLYDQALLIDPDYDQAIINKAGLLMVTSSKAEAKQLLIKYLKRNPGNTKISAVLEQISNS